MDPPIHRIAAGAQPEVASVGADCILKGMDTITVLATEYWLLTTDQGDPGIVPQKKDPASG